MKNILITGGAGFIGYHLTKLLADDSDAAITITDNLQRGRMDDDLKSLLATRPNVSFIQADLTERLAFETLGTDFDQVYHLAAVNGTKHFYDAPHAVLRTNTLTLVHILDWVVSLPKKPKLMFTSSNEAYAGGLNAFGTLPIPTPEAVPLVIDDPYNPRWSYAATKLIGELFVIHYAAKHGFPAVIVRPHNFYGPRAGYDHVIPEFITRIAARTEPFQIFGVDETRSFCYIDDAVLAMRMLMDAANVGSERPETVHIGSTEETSIRALAETLFDVAGWRPSRIESKPSPAGSVKRRLADVSKIESLVGWSSKITLREGLARTNAWYEQHPAPAQATA